MKTSTKLITVAAALLMGYAGAKAQVIFAVAGTVSSGGYSGDGGLALLAKLNGPEGVATDGSGNIYIADYTNNVIRKVTATGVISTVAGNGTGGFSGDGGAATSAELWGPAGVAIDGSGNIYISDQNNQRIRMVTASTGKISTVAGNGTAGWTGDGSPATLYELNYPAGIAVDGSGHLYIADAGNNMVVKLSGTTMSIFAGQYNGGFGGFSGNGGQATAALLNTPEAVAIDGSGNVYIADKVNERIRKVNTSGIISTFAGNGTAGFSGDGSAATSAELNEPDGVSVDGSGNVFIADQQNFRVRKVSTSGTISTYAGNGTNAYTGDGGAATAAEISVNYGIAVTSSGDLFITDYSNDAVREVSSKCPADAGPNVTNKETCCGWSDLYIGTPSVPNMTYAWSPATDLTSTTVARPLTGYSVTTSCIIYTVTVSYSLCTTNTSTVQVCAVGYRGSSCCRLANPNENGFGNIPLPVNFSVYPNPSNSIISIALYDMADYVRIIDMQGRTIYEAQNTDAGEVKLDISQYNKGIYFVTAKIGDKLEKQKLVIE